MWLTGKLTSKEFDTFLLKYPADAVTNMVSAIDLMSSMDAFRPPGSMKFSFGKVKKKVKNDFKNWIITS